MIEIKEILTDNKDLEYIKECAESVGIDVTDRTAFTIPFIAEVMRRMYNKGYDDGREAIAFHYELCKEEGSIITVPDGATNGDMIKAMFSDAEIIFENGFYETTVDWHTKTHRCHFFDNDWWNSPYRKEQE